MLARRFDSTGMGDMAMAVVFLNLVRTTMNAIDVRTGCESERASNGPAGMVLMIGVWRRSGEAAWRGVGQGGERSAGEGGAERRFAKRDTMRAGPILEQVAMARSAGRRAVAGAFILDYSRRLRVFGSGAKHLVEASNVTAT